MRKVVLIVIFICSLLPRVAQAQNDRVEALRMAFINKKLELTASEAEKFWPIYNEYNDKLKALKRNLKQAYRQYHNGMSEKDAADLVHLEAMTRQAEADLYKTYSEKLKAVIGVLKLAKLHLAEEEFRREMIKTIRDKNDWGFFYS